MSIQAAELAHWQRFLPGTTAWRVSYGRRQVVEGANGMLKGGFVNIAHKFFRISGLTKMRILLAATIFGYNLWRIGSFLAKKAKEKAEAEKPRQRAKRKIGTWANIAAKRQTTGRDPSGSGRAPPPT